MTAITLTGEGLLCAQCQSPVSLSAGLCFTCGEPLEEQGPDPDRI